MFERTAQIDPYQLKSVIMIILRKQLDDDSGLRALGIYTHGPSNGHLVEGMRGVLRSLGYEEHDLPDDRYLKDFIEREKRDGILSGSGRYDCYLNKKKIIRSVWLRFRQDMRRIESGSEE